MTGQEIGLFGREWDSQLSPGRVELRALVYVVSPDGTPTNRYCYEWFKTKAAELGIPLIGIQASKYAYSSRKPVGSRNLTPELTIIGGPEYSGWTIKDSANNRVFWIDEDKRLVFQRHVDLSIELTEYLHMSKIEPRQTSGNHQLDRPLNVDEIRWLIKQIPSIVVERRRFNSAKSELLNMLSTVIAEDNVTSISQACKEHEAQANSQTKLIIPGPRPDRLDIAWRR